MYMSLCFGLFIVMLSTLVHDAKLSFLQEFFFQMSLHVVNPQKLARILVRIITFEVKVYSKASKEFLRIIMEGNLQGNVKGYVQITKKILCVLL